MTPLRFLRRLSAGLAAAALLALPVLGASPWTSYRADARNNGVVHTEAPRSHVRSTALWETIYGLGYPGPSLLVDGTLITLHGGYADFGTLTLIDPRDGRLLASQETEQSPTWNTAPPCYGDGRIYCQLDGGTVQAFDGEDLEPLWTFRAPGGGKAHNPIVFRDGRLYVGFGCQTRGSFLCLDAETGKLLWQESTPKGQYSAGALVAGDFVLYGDEAGHLTLRNKNTGALVRDLAVTASPIRSGICLAEGKLFFTAFNGHLFYGSFSQDTGEIGPLTDVDCSSWGLNTLSTPTVYDSYVYLALGSAAGSENHVVCVDTVRNEVAWAVPVDSNPCCSVLLTDAHDDGLYLYVTAGQGGVTVIHVPADGSGPRAEVLFQPDVHSQPSTCSLISGEDGTLYYTNGSSAIFAIAPDEAYLDNLVCSDGRFTRDFDPAETEYCCLVPGGTQSVSFVAQSPGHITLNGGDISQPVVLENGAGAAEFSVTWGGCSRTYRVTVQPESDDTGLADLIVGQDSPENALALIPQFQPGVSDYAVFTVDSSPSRNSVSLWPVLKEGHSQVAVSGVSNVRSDAMDLKTGLISPNLPDQGYEIPFADQTRPMALSIVVTAENGNVREYRLLLSKAQTAIDDIGQVSPDRSSWIGHARAICDGLTDGQLELLPNYSILLHAEKKLAHLEVQTFNDRLAALEPVTPDSGELLSELRKDYNALTEDQQAKVDGYDRLLEAEAAYAALEQPVEVPETPAEETREIQTEEPGEEPLP